VVQKLAVVALTFALGGHWAILQSVAWMTMVAGYSQTAPLKEALVKTFDGKHPCTMCKEISAGKKSEKKAEFSTLGTKLEFVSERPAFVFSAPDDFYLLPETTSTLRELVQQPPVPPPRQLPG